MSLVVVIVEDESGLTNIVPIFLFDLSGSGLRHFGVFLFLKRGEGVVFLVIQSLKEFTTNLNYESHF